MTAPRRPSQHHLESSPEFRDAIGRLEHEAHEQERLAEEDARKKSSSRHFSTIVVGGSALIVVQLGILAYLMFGAKAAVLPQRNGAERPILPPRSCAAVANKTYWLIVRFAHDRGHLPSKLEDLLGRYTDSMPADPVTGRTLEYSTSGDRFTVTCPGAAKAPVT